MATGPCDNVSKCEFNSLTAIADTDNAQVAGGALHAACHERPYRGFSNGTFLSSQKPSGHVTGIWQCLGSFLILPIRLNPRIDRDCVHSPEGYHSS
jgi:hypothetical protein